MVSMDCCTIICCSIGFIENGDDDLFAHTNESKSREETSKDTMISHSMSQKSQSQFGQSQIGQSYVTGIFLQVHLFHKRNQSHRDVLHKSFGENVRKILRETITIGTFVYGKVVGCLQPYFKKNFIRFTMNFQKYLRKKNLQNTP